MRIFTLGNQLALHHCCSTPGQDKLLSGDLCCITDLCYMVYLRTDYPLILPSTRIQVSYILPKCAAADKVLIDYLWLPLCNQLALYICCSTLRQYITLHAVCGHVLQHAVCGHVLCTTTCSVWICTTYNMQLVGMYVLQHAVCGHVLRMYNMQLVDMYVLQHAVCGHVRTTTCSLWTCTYYNMQCVNVPEDLLTSPSPLRWRREDQSITHTYSHMIMWCATYLPER